MTGITTYRWGDPDKLTVIGLTTDPGLFYTIPADSNNKEYKQFVSIGTEFALPYIQPNVILPQDYLRFWVGSVTSSYYSKVKMGSSLGLQTNTSATEFIALIGDAKTGYPSEPLIQNSFNELLTLVPPDDNDKISLQNLLVETNLNSIYTIPFVVGVGSTSP